VNIRRFSLNRVGLAGMVALILLVVASVARASIPDGGGVIHGCYNKSGGALRVIDNGTDHCSTQEKSLDWNQRGPSDGFLTLQTPPNGFEGPIGTDFTDIGLRLSLPAGSYILNASVNVAAILSPVSIPIVCTFLVPGHYLEYDARSEVGGHANAFENVVLANAVTLPTAGDVSVWCQAYSEGVNMQPSTLTAIRVATLTDQTQGSP
jgi:hypothetical protein